MVAYGRFDCRPPVVEKFNKRRVALSSELIQTVSNSFLFPIRCRFNRIVWVLVSKLTIKNQRFGDVLLDRFTFSTPTPRDYKTSPTPAIAFTLRINYPTTKSVQISFMLNLPIGIQPNTVRLGSPDKTSKSTNVSRCLRACIDNKQYMSWQMAKENKTCRLFYQVPPHAWHPGLISGQKSTWTAHDSMLTLNRSGNYPQSGNTTIATGGKRVSPSFMVSNCFDHIWKQFEGHGCLVLTS